MRGLRAQFLKSEEGDVFLVGCVLLILWAGGIVLLWRLGSEQWLHMLTFSFTQLFAGRSACVAYGTQLGLHPALNVLLASYVDAMTVFLAFPLLAFGSRHLVETRFFERRMKPVFDAARARVPGRSRYKALSVFAFVWFPFWMTGVVVGSVLGFLLGLRTWTNMAAVVGGTLAATLCWVAAYDRLFAWLGHIDPRVPLAATAGIIGGLIVYRLLRGRVEASRIRR